MTPFQPTHGFYAHSQPPQVVEDMLRQDIRGIDEEFAALRILGRGLLERQQRATSSREMADLSQAYTLLAYRLAELVRAEKELQEQDQENRQADELMDRWEEGSRELGHPLPEGWREEIIWGDPEQAEASRHLVEEVAGLRHVIRNAFRLAMESQETKDYIRMVDVYGSACIRLVKLLRSQGSYAGRVWAYAGQMIDLALQQVIQEWNLGV